MPLYGWMGKILRVNLSTGKIAKKPLPKELTYNFIGGRGINSKILYSETGPETNPLGPDNKLIVGTGPVTGTLVPTSARFTITAKSPLTGILGDANAGGSIGPELKYAGYDHIIVQGVSEKPVYLWIDDDHVELKNAQHLWGRNTHETERMLKEEIGDSETRVLSIGQAGENLVKIAGIINEEDHAAARCGLGAVMGSKKLKAIAVRGSKTINIAHPDKLFELVDEMYSDYKKCSAWQWYRLYEFTTGVICMCESGVAPIKNYLVSGGTDMDKRQAISHIENSGKYVLKRLACHGCPLACYNWVYIDKLGRCKAPGAGRSHTAIWEIYDYPFLVEFNKLVDQYGLDVYSIQGVIASAMEWYERGIITKENTDGMEIRFGDKDVVISLVHKIAKREGFGNILAEGSIRAAKIVGADPDSTPTGGYGKGMDHGPIDCTAVAGATLSLSLSTRGAGHLRGIAPTAWPPVQGPPPPKWQKVYRKACAEDVMYKPWICHPVNAEIATYFENICTSSDILEICKNTTEFYYFYGYEGREKKDDLEWHADFLKAVTGIEIDRPRLETIARRVLNIEKAYNVREGKLRKHDMPTPRFFKERRGGPLDGKALDAKELEKLFNHYYEIHGWDPKTSIPRRRTLEELGLKYVADELENKYNMQLKG